MLDNFEFSKLISSWQGYNSSKDKTILGDGWLVKGSQNVYKKRSGTLAVRPGLKRRGSADTTVADVKSSYVWKTSWGENRVLRVANSKLEVESDIVTSGTFVWYTLQSSIGSSNTDFSFRAVWDNTDKKDFLVFTEQDSSLYSWAGGIITVLSGTGGPNTITKQGTTTWAQEGFASTGTVTISGVDYTYTGGTTTTTLTGVGIDASGLTAGLVGVSKIVTNTNKPASGFTNNFLEVVNNQLYCFSSTSRLVYVSQNTNYTNFTEPGTRVAGDPKIFTLDSIPNGVAVRQGKAHVFGGTADLFILSYQDITVSTNLVNQANVDKKELAELQACLGHNFIDTIGDTIVYLSQDQQLRTYGDTRNFLQPVFPPLSLPVFDELYFEDFTGGELKAIGEFIYITAPNNGKTYLYQQRQYINSLGNITTERLWHPPFIWNISRLVSINGVVYGHSNANPQIYQVWDTEQWHDDAPTTDAGGNFEQLPYTAIVKLAYRNHGRRQGIISFDKIYYEGYITNGTVLNSDVLFEYQGFAGKQTLIISEPSNVAYLMSGASFPSLGDSSLGDNPLGDGIQEETNAVLNSQEKLSKFKDIETVTPENCSEYQLTLYSNIADSRWELLVIGTNASLSGEEQPIKFTKSS